MHACYMLQHVTERAAAFAGGGTCQGIMCHGKPWCISSIPIYQHLPLDDVVGRCRSRLLGWWEHLVITNSSRLCCTSCIMEHMWATNMQTRKLKLRIHIDMCQSLFHAPTCSCDGTCKSRSPEPAGEAPPRLGAAPALGAVATCTQSTLNTLT